MKLDFCPECAKPLTKDSETKYVCPNGHIFWNNPKTCVAVILLKQRQVLVSMRAVEPLKGMYDFPGGFVEYNEDLFAAAVRETLEETSLRISDLQIVASYTGEYVENVSFCDVIIHARKWEGEPIASDDSAALEWKPLEFLDTPEFDPLYKGLRQKLEPLVHTPNTL